MSPVKANVGAVGVLIQSRRVLGSRFDPKNDPKNDPRNPRNPRNPRDEKRSLPRLFLLKWRNVDVQLWNVSNDELCQLCSYIAQFPEVDP